MYRIAATLLALSLLACASPTFDAGVHYGEYSIDGGLGFGSGGVNGTTPLNRIGLGDDSPVGVSATVGLGNTMLLFSATTPSFKGRGTLDADIDVGGITINQGADVYSKLNVGMYQGLLLFEIIPGSTVDLAVGLGINLLHLTGSFTDNAAQTKVSLDQAVPIPVLAARTGVEVGPVGLSALVTWIGVSYDGSDLSALDLDLRAEMEVYGPMIGYAGYRNTSLDIYYQDGSDFGDFDFDISGIYIGVGVSF
ncbi:MAG: hypothetical protein OSB42_09565 [Planctomycetota bacterium]|nr:hypothetical protein [Planctomycetota bacterium]